MVLAYRGAGFRYQGWRAAAVAEIDLLLPPAGCLLLAGVSGSGKSTLVRMANGLIPHFYSGEFRGAVLVAGVDTRRRAVRELAGKVGVVFQNQEAQLFNATVERELAFGPCQLGVPREEVVRRVRWAAEQTGVAHLLARPTQRLSGGESARVAVACVLATRPAALVLDEPSAALDPLGARSLWSLLAGLRRGGTAVMVAEHRPEACWEQVEAVAVIDGGGIVFDGTRADATRAPLAGRILPAPAMSRLFAAAGLPERPVGVAEAAAILRARHLTPLARGGESPEPGETLLLAEGVGFERDGRPVLSGVDLRLRRGETVALVGPNGAGKTTLLRLLAGLARPRRGRVVDGDGEAVRPGQIGMLFQNAADALFCPTVRQEVEYGARLLRRYDAARVEALCTWLALQPLLDRSPLALSEGEKRRVALAAALAHRPEVLLLDEPTAGQDAGAREALAALLAALRAEGLATLLATHDLEFAARHCRRWLVLAGGELLADTTPEGALNDAALLARASLAPTPAARLAAALGVPYTGEECALVPAGIAGAAR